MKGQHIILYTRKIRDLERARRRYMLELFTRYYNMKKSRAPLLKRELQEFIDDILASFL